MTKISGNIIRMRMGSVLSIDDGTRPNRYSIINCRSHELISSVLLADCESRKGLIVTSRFSNGEGEAMTSVA
jgi:hypothetical protein